MTGRREHLSNDTVGPEKLSPSFRTNRYCFEQFMTEPLCFKKQSLTAPGGTSLDECIVDTGRYRFEYVFLGDHTDVLVPRLASDGGYNWAFDSQTLDRGVEINFGSLKTGHPRTFTPSSEDWFARALVYTNNASGLDLMFGARKVAAYAATLTEYSDVIGIRSLGDSSSTTGTFTFISNLNNGGSTDYTSTTPTTTITPLEDDTAVELEIRSRGGVAEFYVNGVRHNGLMYTFDSGDVFSPVLRAIQTTDLATQVKTLGFECGLLGPKFGPGALGDRQEGLLVNLVGATA